MVPSHILHPCAERAGEEAKLCCLESCIRPLGYSPMIASATHAQAANYGHTVVVVNVRAYYMQTINLCLQSFVSTE